MRYVLLVALLSASLTVSPVFAEPKTDMAQAKSGAANAADGEEEDQLSAVDRRMEALTAGLSLSKTQQAEVRKILENAREQQREALVDLRKQALERREEIRMSSEKKIEGLLKADQKAKFDAMKAVRPAGRQMKDAQAK